MEAFSFLAGLVRVPLLTAAQGTVKVLLEEKYSQQIPEPHGAGVGAAWQSRVGGRPRAGSGRLGPARPPAGWGGEAQQWGGLSQQAHLPPPIPTQGRKERPRDYRGDLPSVWQSWGLSEASSLLLGQDRPYFMTNFQIFSAANTRFQEQ